MTPPRTALSRFWPILVVAALLLAGVIGYSLTNDCATVDRTLFPTDSAQSAAYAAGDTIPTADPRAGTDVAVQACGRRF